MPSPQVYEWKNAMPKMCTNETLDVVELPEGERVVGARWVYTVTLDC